MKRCLPLVFSLTMLVLVPPLSHAADIGSTDIKRGAVKGRHIHKNAVRGSDIARGAVKSSDIRDSTITADDLAPGSVGSNQIQDGAVGTTTLADSAVTSAKLAPGAVGTAALADSAVTSAKLAPETVGAATLADSAVTSAKLAPGAVYSNTVIVRADGPTSNDNCIALQMALAGISDSAADNPYLVYIEPGAYSCGSSPVILPPFVGLAGAGRNLTRIEGAIEGQDGLLNVPLGGEVRDLTVHNMMAAGITKPRAISDIPGGSGGILLRNVAARASGGADNQESIAILFDEPCPDPCVHRLTDVLATAEAVAGNSAKGLTFVDAFTVVLSNVIAIGQGTPVITRGMGLAASTTHVIARNSVFVGADTATSSSIPIQVTSGTADIAHSQIDGGNVSGAMTCVGAYDEDFAALQADCKTLVP